MTGVEGGKEKDNRRDREVENEEITCKLWSWTKYKIKREEKGRCLEVIWIIDFKIILLLHTSLGITYQVTYWFLNTNYGKSLLNFLAYKHGNQLNPLEK